MWRWAPVGAQMGAIFYLSGQSDVPSLPGGLAGYTGHMIGYALLGVLALRAWAGATWRGVTRTAALKAVLLASAYGVTDEVHQSFVDNRFPGADDWVADTIGASIGVLIVMGVARLRQTRDPRGRDV